MSKQRPSSPRPPAQLNIDLPAELEAIYANFVIITHSSSEVVLDFARVLPNVPKGKVHARILMTPMNAKLLHRALGENLKKFESQFGEIRLPEAQPPGAIPFEDAFGLTPPKA